MDEHSCNDDKKIEIVCKLEKVNGKIQFLHGEQHELNAKWDKPIVTYAVVVGSKDAGIFSRLRRVVGYSFTTWGLWVPLKFKRVKKSQNPDVTIEFVNDPESNSIFKGNKNILAFAYYPKTSHQGVIKFNDFAYEWDVVDKYVKNVRHYNTFHVMIHELGHTLGLPHAEGNNTPDMMDPYYHDQVNLSEYDISRIQAKYGKRLIKPGKLERMWNFLKYRKRNLR